MNDYWQRWRDQGRALTVAAWSGFTLALIGHWAPPHIATEKIIAVGAFAAGVTALAAISRRATK